MSLSSLKRHRHMLPFERQSTLTLSNWCTFDSTSHAMTTEVVICLNAGYHSSRYRGKDLYAFSHVRYYFLTVSLHLHGYTELLIIPYGVSWMWFFVLKVFNAWRKIFLFLCLDAKRVAVLVMFHSYNGACLFLAGYVPFGTPIVSLQSADLYRYLRSQTETYLTP